MDYSKVERRHKRRQEAQHQPQQSAVFLGLATATPGNAKLECPRKVWQELANAQARRQSGKL